MVFKNKKVKQSQVAPQAPGESWTDFKKRMKASGREGLQIVNIGSGDALPADWFATFPMLQTETGRVPTSAPVAVTDLFGVEQQPSVPVRELRKSAGFVLDLYAQFSAPPRITIQKVRAPSDPNTSEIQRLRLRVFELEEQLRRMQAPAVVQPLDAPTKRQFALRD